MKKIELGKVSLAERKRRTHFDRSRLNLEAPSNAATHQKKSKSNITRKVENTKTRTYNVSNVIKSFERRGKEIIQFTHVLQEN